MDARAEGAAEGRRSAEEDGGSARPRPFRQAELPLRPREKEFKQKVSLRADRLDTGVNWRVLVLSSEKELQRGFSSVCASEC